MLGLKCEGQADQESRRAAPSARSPRHGLLQRLAAAVAGLHGRCATQATALAFKLATTYTGSAVWVDVHLLHRPSRAIARSEKPTHNRQLI